MRAIAQRGVTMVAAASQTGHSFTGGQAPGAPRFVVSTDRLAKETLKW